MPKPPRKGRGTKAAKETKRRAVAKGIVAGKERGAIAREAGCSERHVDRLAEEPETRLLVTELMRPHRAALERIVENAIAAVEGGLRAETPLERPDHTVRLRAVGRAKQLLELAEGREPEKAGDTAEDKIQMTWPRFCELYDQAQKGKQHEST